jgi:hypothetical protein
MRLSSISSGLLGTYCGKPDLFMDAGLGSASKHSTQDMNDRFEAESDRWE